MNILLLLQDLVDSSNFQNNSQSTLTPSCLWLLSRRWLSFCMSNF